MEKIADSAYVVNGIYYANLFDADRQRKWQAEREQRESERRAAYLARQLEQVEPPRTREDARAMLMPAGPYRGRPLAQVPPEELTRLFDHLEQRRAEGVIGASGTAYLIGLERLFAIIPEAPARVA
jgi:hypothetical protein